MKWFTLLTFSSFVYLNLHILEQTVCDASSSVQRNPNKKLAYAIFKDHFFHDLDVTILEAVIVETDKKCLLRCVKNYQCFSTNIAALSHPNGTVLCVLLSSDKYSAPEKFRTNHSFHHYSIVTPCESFPCQNSGICQPIYITNDYVCKCKRFWVGTHCEIEAKTTCKEYYDLNLAEGNKAYPLKLGSDLLPVYCHMTADLGACGGGGWTLVIKMDGSQTTFHYYSNLWSNNETYNVTKGETGLDLDETKLPTYWNTSFTKICLGMQIGQQINFIVINKQANSLYSLIADGQHRATSLGGNTWKGLIGPQVSSLDNCNKEGFNVLSTTDIALYAKARIGFITNNENDCTTCNARIGFGTGGWGDDSNTCGNTVASMWAPYANIKAMGYIFVQ